ncbi:hypothetical protein ACWDE0_38625 [Streptomyces sp. 900105755]
MPMAGKVARSLLAAPVFPRPGLVLALERRPTERRGRTVFLQVRAVSRRHIAEIVATLFPSLTEDGVDTLTAYAVAGADGPFVHREVQGGPVDLVALFELHARLIHDAAARAGR